MIFGGYYMILGGYYMIFGGYYMIYVVMCKKYVGTRFRSHILSHFERC